jgi:YaiO family outer membrane protein
VNLSWAHQWLENERFISRIGVQYYDWRENRSQKGLSFEQIWYAPWNGIVQFGRTQGTSSPGNVSINSNYIAHTWLLKNSAQLLVRYEQAKEGYMALGETTEIVDFDSKTLSLGLSYPIYKNNQLQWRWDRYHNPFYQRNTLSGAWSLQW